MQNITYSPIDIIKKPHVIQEETPAQPVYAKGIKETVEVFSEYLEGLNDLNKFNKNQYTLHFVIFLII